MSPSYNTFSMRSFLDIAKLKKIKKWFNLIFNSYNSVKLNIQRGKSSHSQLNLFKTRLYADKWLDYTRTIHIALKMLKDERWLFKDNKLL